MPHSPRGYFFGFFWVFIRGYNDWRFNWPLIGWDKGGRCCAMCGATPHDEELSRVCSV